MNITKARRVAKLVDEQQFKDSQPEIRAAFQRLHKSAEKGNAEDRKLAKVLWDFCAE